MTMNEPSASLSFDISAPDQEGETCLIRQGERLKHLWLKHLAASSPEINKGTDYLLSLALVDDKTIQNLNNRFRLIDKPTNVLSFPSNDTSPDIVGEPVFLGDVILSGEICTREALQADIDYEDHLMHLMLHGLLHILGYDHETDHEAERMEALETELLAYIGIADPYALENKEGAYPKFH